MAPTPNPAATIQVASPLSRVQPARPALSALQLIAPYQQPAAQQHVQLVQPAAQQHQAGQQLVQRLQQREAGNPQQGGLHMSPTYGSGAMPLSEMGSQSPDPSGLQSVFDCDTGDAVRGLFMHFHSGHACPARRPHSS